MKTLLTWSSVYKVPIVEELCVKSEPAYDFFSCRGGSKSPYDLTFIVIIFSCKPKCFNVYIKMTIFLLRFCTLLNTKWQLIQKSVTNTLTHKNSNWPKNTQIPKELNLSLSSLETAESAPLSQNLRLSQILKVSILGKDHIIT